MEIHKKLDQLAELVESARTMPMSSSAIVNKTDVLALIGEVREMLPESLAAADSVISQREELLEEARSKASKIVSDARAEQAKLVGDHTVLVEARRERGRTLERTRQEVEAMKSAFDDHIDAKLAHVEVVAERIADTVREGRRQLQRTTPYDELGADELFQSRTEQMESIEESPGWTGEADPGPARDPDDGQGAERAG